MIVLLVQWNFLSWKSLGKAFWFGHFNWNKKKTVFLHERVQAIDGNKDSNLDVTDYFTGHNLVSNSRKSDEKYLKRYNSTLKVCIYCG